MYNLRLNFHVIPGKCNTLMTKAATDYFLTPHLHRLLSHVIVLLYSTAIDCGTLNDTTNGQVSHTAGTTFGQTATYSCDTGYDLVGNSIRTCQADGMWSGNEPTCISKSNLTVHMWPVT